jgi:hypothetical protein
MPSISGIAINYAGLPDRLLANADATGKEKQGAPVHRVMPHRVLRGSNFGQLVSGFNSGRSAARSG